MDAISTDGTARPSGGHTPPAETGLLATLAALLDHLGLRYHWRGGKLLMPAVWHGKTKLTVAVWPGGGWNNAACFGEHGTWRDLLDRLGIEDPADREALARAAATVTPARLAEQAQQDRLARLRRAQAWYERAQTLDTRPRSYLQGPDHGVDRHRQARRRQQLEPARQYLRRRGLSAAVIAALTELEQPHRSHETLIRYVDEGFHGGYLVFPLQRGTYFQPSQVLGVQRVYLDAQGRRRPGPGPDSAPKQMLGAATYPLADGGTAAAACWLHRDAQPGGTVILCEGPETGLACWDASALQALVGIHFSATGLAQVDAERVRRLEPAQVIIAADRDVSGTGQQAAQRCAQRLHQAGVVNIRLALPPRDWEGMPLGNAKGTDWLDVLAHVGPERTGALLREHADPYVPPPPAPTPAEVLPLHRLRPCAVAPSPPVRLPPAEARALTATLTRQAVQQPDGVTVVACQTGLGKSQAVRDALLDPATPPTLVVAPTTALVTDLVTAYPGADLGRYLGRSPDPASPGHCLRFPHIEDLRTQRRSIVAHECQHCPHGLAASRHPDAMEKLLAALNRESYGGVLDLHDPAARRELQHDADRVKPCPWVQQRENLRLYPHAAASQAAYNLDHAKTLDKTAPGQPPRQVVLDETPPTVDEVVIDLTTLGQWLATHAAEATTPPSGLEPDRWANLHSQMDAWLRTLARLLGQHPVRCNTRITTADLDLPALIALLEVYPRALDGLRPEAVRTDAQGRRVLTPLRALDTLKQALEQGLVWLHQGTLILQTPSRYLREWLAGTRPLTLTDATPRLLLRALATAGPPVLAETPQLTFHLHPGRLHGCAAAQDPGELQDLLQVLETAARTTPGRVCALLNSKALAKQVRRLITQGHLTGWQPEDADRIGWFGRHDRGQNDWIGCQQLILWGVPRPPPHVMERLYEAERAFAAQAGLHWQPWTAERTLQWFALPYAAAEGSGLELAAQLPTNPDQAAWERDYLTAQVMQGAGRLRPLATPGLPLAVQVYTHYPLAGHGLWFDQVHPPGPRAGGTPARAQWRQELQEDSQARYELARAAGHRSRRTINAWLKA